MLQLRLLVCLSLAVCTWRYKHTTLHAPMVWTAQCVQPCCVVCAYWLWLEQFSTSDEVGHDVIWHKKCLMSQQLVFRRGCMGWQKLLSQQKSSEKCSRSLDVTLEWYIKTWGNPATPSVPKSYSVRYVTVWNFSLNWAKYTILPLTELSTWFECFICKATKRGRLLKLKRYEACIPLHTNWNSGWNHVTLSNLLCPDMTP